MSDFDPLFQQTEQKYGLPPGILAATAAVESSNNPRAVSPQGAEGLMQLLPSTAQNLHANPLDPAQAVDAAGRLWQQNLKASGGDIDRAAMMYHGGPDTRQWGPKTQAYPAKLAAHLQGSAQPEGGDPIEAALSGQPAPQAPSAQSAPQQGAPADPHDPIESALAGNAPAQAPAQSDVNAAMKSMYEARDGKGQPKFTTQQIVAYGVQHGLTPNADQIDQARKQGFGTVNFQYHDDANPPQAQPDQALGFVEGLTKPIDNAATWLKEGADKLGVGGAIDSLGTSLGLPSLQQANANQQTYFKGQEAQGKTPGGWGQLAGSILASLPIAAITKNPAVLGGISSALDSDNPNDAHEVAKNAIFGAVGGKLTDGLVGGVTKAISPNVSAAVQKLHDLGVQMTPGQIMGGALKRLEDGATSIPFFGDLIKNAQRRSALSLNSSVINDRVLSPIGKSLPAGATGREAVDFADKTISDAYNQLLPKLTVQADKPFVQNIGQIMQAAGELPADRAAQVQRIIQESVGNRFSRPGYQMTGDTFKEVDAKLGQLGREYSSSGDPEQRKMGGIFRDVQTELRNALERSNPAQAPELKSINQAFANLVRVEGAAGSAGAKGGVWSPAHLGAAVKRFDPSARKKGYATGNALLQDVSDAAQEVLPSSVPDSGTPYRTIGAYLLGGGAAHVSPFLAPLAAPVALYTKAGQKVFQKAALAPRGPGAQALAKALTKMKAPLAVAGGAASADAAHAF